MPKVDLKDAYFMVAISLEPRLSFGEARFRYTEDRDFPQVHMQGQMLQVQLPTIRPGMCPLGFHQGSETSSSSAQRARDEND